MTHSIVSNTDLAKQYEYVLISVLMIQQSNTFGNFRHLD